MEKGMNEVCDQFTNRLPLAMSTDNSAGQPRKAQRQEKKK